MKNLSKNNPISATLSFSRAISIVPLLLMPIASAWIQNPQTARSARSMRVSPLYRTRASSSKASTPSEYSDYGQQDVYWNDINGFPQEDIIDPEVMPSMEDMRNSFMGGGNRMHEDDRIYETDKYYRENQGFPSSSSSSSRFEDIPFQSNENYAKKFHRNAQREREEFDNRRMGGPYGPPDMMGPGGGGGMYGASGMPPPPGMRENEMFPPPGGMMGSMQDPYGGGQYGMPYGGMGMMEPGMMGNGMMMGGGMGGDWGFQEMGMGPGGQRWGREEYGYGGGPGGGGGGFGQQQMQGQPFANEPFQGPGGGFW